MARVTKKAKLADQQDLQQPALLDDSQLPVCLPVLEAVRQRRYEHVGARLTDDDERCLRLVELLVARWGIKKISREMNISPHTVRAARRALTAQGKLATYVQRVVESMEDAIEAGIANYRDALEDGRISAGQIPVGLGIIFDKRQLATNQATSISASTVVAEDLSVDKLNSFLEKLEIANSPISVPEDSQSSGLVAEGQQIQGDLPADATLDVSSTRPSPDGRTGPEPTDLARAIGLEPGRPAVGDTARAPGWGAGGGSDGDAGPRPDALG